MNWLERISSQPVNESPEDPHSHESDTERMKPGLTGQYDEELREKAAFHMPPPPPEYMGTEGEYDPAGLAKRVALALNDDPVAHQIDSLDLIQSGSTICLQGQIDNQAHLEHVIRVAAQVDGTEAVDVSRVVVQGH